MPLFELALTLCCSTSLRLNVPSARSRAARTQAYRKWGARFARHFEGEFAIAIFDLAKRKIFVSTDPFGVKPLFVALAPDAFGVSSCTSDSLSTALDRPPKLCGLCRPLIGLCRFRAFLPTSFLPILLQYC